MSDEMNLTSDDREFEPVDFSSVPDLGPVPQGTYPVECIKATSGISKTDNPKVDVQWKVTEGEYEGRIIFGTHSFATKAQPFLKRDLEQLDVDTSEGVSPASLAEALLGWTTNVFVVVQEGGVNPETQEKYDDRNNIRKYGVELA